VYSATVSLLDESQSVSAWSLEASPVDELGLMDLPGGVISVCSSYHTGVARFKCLHLACHPIRNGMRTACDWLPGKTLARALLRRCSEHFALWYKRLCLVKRI
jgi:hypothetical protein